MKIIEEICVNGLFGVFNHPVRLKNEVGITLIIGPNGLGKTQILQMVKAFFERNFIEIQSQIFQEFAITFTDNETISITKETSDHNSTLHFRLFKGKRKTEEYKMSFNDHDLFKSSRRKRQPDNFYFSEPEFLVQKLLPNFDRIGNDRWIDRQSGHVFSSRGIWDMYGHILPAEFTQGLEKRFPEWLSQLTDSTKVKFIETQRLLMKIKTEEAQYRSSVDNYSKELVETIKNKRVAAIDLASKLDRTFPNRIIKSVSEAMRISDAVLQEGLAKLDQKRELLNRVGLIDTDEEYITPFQYIIQSQSEQKQEILKDVLYIYIKDSNQKLSTYDELASKIELLIEIINKRFLYKKISIDKNKGFVFTSTITGKNIPLSGLSSGEQHELVLFFQLLFATEPNSLLLIDEPEISLHISWQKEFINDLKQVIQITNLSVIIATHSPDIIGNYWNLTVQLDGV